MGVSFQIWMFPWKGVWHECSKASYTYIQYKLHILDTHSCIGLSMALHLDLHCWSLHHPCLITCIKLYYCNLVFLSFTFSFYLSSLLHLFFSDNPANLQMQDCSCCTLIAEKFALDSPEILAGRGFSRLLVHTTSLYYSVKIMFRFIYMTNS